MKDTMKTSLSSRDSIIEGNMSPPTIKPHQGDSQGSVIVCQVSMSIKQMYLQEHYNLKLFHR